MMYQARQRWQPSVTLTTHLSTKFTQLFISWDSTRRTFRDIFRTAQYDTTLGKSQQIKVKTFSNKKNEEMLGRNYTITYGKLHDNEHTFTVWNQ